MLNKFSKAFLLEFVLFQVVAFRLVYFYRVTLRETLESVRGGLSGHIADKEATCDRLANLYVVLENSNATVENASIATAQLVKEIRECTIEAGRLRAFAWSVQPHMLYDYFTSPGTVGHSLSMDTIRRATTPSSAYRCDRLLCVDWSSALSVVPTMSLMFGWINGSSDPVHESALLSLIGSCSVFIICFVLRWALEWMATKTGSAILSRVCVSFTVPFLPQYRLLRCILLGVVYLLAFSVTRRSVEWTVLIRMLVSMSSLSRVHASVGMTLLASVLVGLGRHEADALGARKMLNQLDTLDKDVAWMWMNGPPSNLGKLRGWTLIQILEITGFAELEPQTKVEVSRLIRADPVLERLVFLHPALTEASSIARYSSIGAQAVLLPSIRGNPRLAGLALSCIFLALLVL